MVQTLTLRFGFTFLENFNFARQLVAINILFTFIYPEDTREFKKGNMDRSACFNY